MSLRKKNFFFFKLLIPLFLVLLSFIIRFALISKGPFHSDTVRFALEVVNSVQDGRMHYLHSHGFPLTAILGVLFYKLSLLFGVHDAVWAVNFMSVVFGSLSTLPLYYIIKNLYDDTAALAGSLLFIITPIFMMVSVFGNSHTPATFFILMAVSCLIHYFKENIRLSFYTGAAFLGLAGAARISELVVMIIPLIVFYHFGTNIINATRKTNDYPFKKQCRDIFQGALICAFVVLLFYTPLLNNIFSTKLVATEFTDYYIGIFSPVLLNSLGYLIDNFTWFGIIIVIVGAGLSIRTHTKTFIVLLTWFLIPFLFFGNNTISSHRFFILSIIPLVIFQAYFIRYIRMRCSFFAKTCGILLLIILMVLSFTTIYPVLRFRHNHAVTPAFANWVAHMTPDNSFIIAGQERIFIEYYTNRPAASYVPIFGDSHQSLESVKNQYKSMNQKILNHLNNDLPVYITGTGLYGDNTGVFEKFIRYKYDLKRVGIHYYENWLHTEMKITVIPVELFLLTKKSSKEISL